MTYFTGFLGSSQKKNLYVHYLSKLLIYGCHICTTSAPDMYVPSERFIPGLTYFSRSQGQNVKKVEQLYTVAQIVTSAHRYL